MALTAIQILPLFIFISFTTTTILYLIKLKSYNNKFIIKNFLITPFFTI
jgi:hypothetical protein